MYYVFWLSEWLSIVSRYLFRMWLDVIVGSAKVSCRSSWWLVRLRQSTSVVSVMLYPFCLTITRLTCGVPAWMVVLVLMVVEEICSIGLKNGV